jgi:16S rRNA (cytosine1402-N4)-methyltransferase
LEIKDSSGNVLSFNAKEFVPSFGGAAAIPAVTPAATPAARPDPLDDPATCAQLSEIRQEMAIRKAWLAEQGLSASACKKDKVLRELCRRQDNLQKAKLQHKIYARGVQRAHVSVLLHEAVDHLMSVGSDGTYVDCTFGRGGHSGLILSKLSEAGRLVAFDIDPMSVTVGRALQSADARFEMIHAPFSELATAVPTPTELAGVLLDLGVSSPQLDEASRGFSVKGRKDGPLDLRMNQECGPTAAEWLEAANASEIAWVLRQTCHALEPPLHDRVAEELYVWQRQHGGFRSTQQFTAMLRDLEAEIIAEHPTLKLPSLVKTSLRIFLNHEIPQLDLALRAAFERLTTGGRCCIICFNRWEVAAVRHFVRCHEEPSEEVVRALPPERLAELYPLLGSDKPYAVRRVTRPIRPTQEELACNQRAKSSLHVLEKVPRAGPRPL